MSDVIEVSEAWRGLAARIEAEAGRVVLLGTSDSGKTTLARWLVGQLARGGRRVAILDGDIGQSTVGPPATAGLALVPPFSSDPCFAPVALRFIGATSPARQMLPLVVALERLAEQAIAAGAEILLVDTTGLVLGPLGRRLKFYKLDLLAPRHLVALQRGDELEPILRLVEGRKGMVLHRLPVSRHAAPRSIEARRAYRTGRFADYFRKAGVLEVRLREVAVQGAWIAGGRGLGASELRGLARDLETTVLAGERSPDEVVLVVQGEPAADSLSLVRSRFGAPSLRVIDVEAVRGLLVGLSDAENELLALGLLQRFDPGRGTLDVLAPPVRPERVHIVHFGALRLRPSGEEIGEELPPTSADAEPGDCEALPRDRRPA
jgi:polynucleotide 5'-hydroxyl-kinase GRC3/NOL9